MKKNKLIAALSWHIALIIVLLVSLLCIWLMFGVSENSIYQTVFFGSVKSRNVVALTTIPLLFALTLGSFLIFRKEHSKLVKISRICSLILLSGVIVYFMVVAVIIIVGLLNGRLLGGWEF